VLQVILLHIACSCCRWTPQWETAWPRACSYSSHPAADFNSLALL